LRETSDTVLVAGQIGGTFVFGALAAPFGWVTRRRATSPDAVRRAGDARACLRQPIAETRTGERRGAVPVHAHRLGDRAGLFRVRRCARPATLAGAAIIIAAGLFIFWREQVRGRSVAAVVEPP
jgi:hypothetical protein